MSGAHPTFGDTVAGVVIVARKVLFQNVAHDVIDTCHRIHGIAVL